MFARWSDYVVWRLPSVIERVRTTDAFSPTAEQRIVEAIARLADDVCDVARPSICHRDLYLDNLLATPDGDLSAILDFDGAESWDAATDLVKLRWTVFPHHPGADAAFAAAYGERPMWRERVKVAELLTLFNTVPNAMTHGFTVYEASARARLAVVLES
jgi:aminoglycoside phosphotransferase (APT) family kinase protein